MVNRSNNGSFIKFWVMGILLVCIIQAALAFVLFSRQQKQMNDVQEKFDFINQFHAERLKVIEIGAERFVELVKLVNNASATLLKLDVIKPPPPVDAVMVSVSESSTPLELKILEIVPITPPETALAPLDSWRIRCSGAYDQVVDFMAMLESRGLVFDAGNFSIKTIKEGGVELSAVAKICTVENLEKAAAPKPVAAPRAAAARTTR